MRIAVAGTGYVGLSNAILLAQHNEVIAVDVVKERVELINKGISPFVDKEIEEYLKERHQGYVTDSSNLVNDITRNKIRLDIMPILHEINPSVIDAISNTAEHVWQAMPLIDEYTRYYENKVKEDTEYGISNKV